MNQEAQEQEFLVFSMKDVNDLDPKLVNQLRHIKTTIAIKNHKIQPAPARPLNIVGYRHASHGGFHSSLEEFEYSFGDSKEAISLADASPLLRTINDLQDALTRAQIALVATPTITTAMKAAVIGDYKVQVDEICSACDLNGADPDCEACSGTVHYTRSEPVPWTMCKDIFLKMTEISRAEQIPSQATPAPGTGYIPVHKVLRLLDLFQSGKLTPNTPDGWKSALQLDAFNIHADTTQAGAPCDQGIGMVGDTIVINRITPDKSVLYAIGHKGKITDVFDDAILVNFNGWLGQPVEGDGEWMVGLDTYTVTAKGAVINNEVVLEAL